MTKNKPSGLNIFTFATLASKPIVKEGLYSAKITDIDVHKQFSRSKLLIQASVESEPGIRVSLTYFANIKLTDTGQIIEPTNTMALTKTLHHLFPDRKISCLNLNELIGLDCFAEVKLVTLDYRKKERNPAEYYSKISQLYHYDFAWEQVVPET